MPLDNPSYEEQDDLDRVRGTVIEAAGKFARLINIIEHDPEIKAFLDAHLEAPLCNFYQLVVSPDSEKKPATKLQIAEIMTITKDLIDDQAWQQIDTLKNNKTVVYDRDEEGQLEFHDTRRAGPRILSVNLKDIRILDQIDKMQTLLKSLGIEEYLQYLNDLIKETEHLFRSTQD